MGQCSAEDNQGGAKRADAAMEAMIAPHKRLTRSFSANLTGSSCILVLLLIAAFYWIEARGLGLLTGLIMIAIAELSRGLPFAVGLGLFLVGWAVQFIGHARFEHRSPAFLRNLVHLLVGPAWLVERALPGERAA